MQQNTIIITLFFLVLGLEISKISDPSDREQEFLPHPIVESRMSRGSEI